MDGPFFDPIREDTRTTPARTGFFPSRAAGRLSDPCTAELPLSRPNRRPWKLLLGFAISIGCLVWVGSGLDFVKLRAALAGVKWGWVAAHLGVMLVVLVLKGLRWRLILRAADPDDDPRGAFDAMMAGYFGNSVLPAKLGEALRTTIYAARHRLGVAEVAATIVFERVIDVGVLVAIFWAAAMSLELPDWVRWFGWAGGGIFAVAMVVLYALMAGAGRNSKRGGLLGRLESMVVKFGGGLLVLRQPRLLAATTGLSVAVWGLEVVLVTMLLRAFSLTIPFAAGALFTSVVTLAGIVPSGPGAMGVHQKASLEVLRLYGVEQEVAVAVSVVLVATLTLVSGILGPIGGLRQGFAIGQLVRLGSGQAAPPAEAGDSAVEDGGEQGEAMGGVG